MVKILRYKNLEENIHEKWKDKSYVTRLKDESELHFGDSKYSYFLTNKNLVKKDKYKKIAANTIKRCKFSFSISTYVYIFILGCCSISN